MSVTTAIILAGGLGTRLRSILSDCPKVLAPVGGKPFLGYLLQYLASQGVQEVILSVGYLAHQVKAFAPIAATWNLQVRIVQETAPLGTAGAARLASSGLLKPFLLVNGDTLFLVDISALEKAHRQSAALATMCLRHMTDVSARGRVEIDTNGLIQNFQEKTQIQGNALANGGIYLFEPGALDIVPEGKPASLETDLFPKLASMGKLAGFVQDAYFCDIGTPESLAEFENDLRSGKVTLA
jgi:D-glycero-alpha-D-manno-heptose 1-phosphate guanylyltransferase